jgi:hypothetical protein
LTKSTTHLSAAGGFLRLVAVGLESLYNESWSRTEMAVKAEPPYHLRPDHGYKSLSIFQLRSSRQHIHYLPGELIGLVEIDAARSAYFLRHTQDIDLLPHALHFTIQDIASDIRAIWRLRSITKATAYAADRATLLYRRKFTYRAAHP